MKRVCFPNYSVAYILFVLFITSIFIKLFIVYRFGGPICFFDELRYRLNAFSIYEGVKYATSHYPPIYPLALAPAFFVKRWYEGMLFLNVMWSSMLIPAVYFLGYSVNLRRPIIAAILAALLPFHVVYPRYILSENIFLPLFVISFALAIRGGIGGKFESLLFGVILGLAHLTRYLFLPSVPLFFCVWIVIFFIRYSDSFSVYCFDFTKNIFLVVTGYVCLISLWILIGFESGFHLNELFGFGVSGVTSAHFVFGNFLLWCVLYGSYVFLMAFPVWILVSFFSFVYADIKIFFQFKKETLIFLVLLLVLIICYWLIAAKHSSAARYNSITPLYIIGRYLMHLAPILMIIYVWILEKIEQNYRRFLISKTCFLIIGLVVLGEICRKILFSQLILDLPAWFAAISFNATDVFNFNSNVLIIAYALSIFLTILFLYFGVKDSRVLVVPLTVVLTLNLFLSYDRLVQDDDGFHSREVFDEFSKYFESRKLINLIVDNETISLKLLMYGCNFWNIDGYDMNLNVYENLDLKLDFNGEQKYLLSSSLFNADEVRAYANNDKIYHIYKINNENKLNFRPQILSISPSSTQSNLGFNIQPTGNSALGLMVSSVSTRAFLKFEDKHLAIAHGSDGFVSAEIPHELLAIPRVFKIRICDPLTGLESDDVEFSVLP